VLEKIKRISVKLSKITIKMGLTKQYLAYKNVGNFNIIASTRANGVFLNLSNVEGRYFAVSGAENVLIWDLRYDFNSFHCVSSKKIAIIFRIGEKICELTRGSEEITCLCGSSDNLYLAVGYTDGVICIFNLRTKELESTLTLHRSGVSCLKFDQFGLKLLSGGLDTDLVVSDVVEQTGKCRLIGHTSAITDACFMEKYNDVAISCSKDSQVKFWNIESQYCFKTIVDHHAEVWGIGLLRNSSYLVTGSKDNSLRVYKLLESKEPETDDDAVSPFRCNFVGIIQRTGKGRTVNLVTDPSGQVLGCSGTDDEIELFYFCNPEESLHRLTKRLKKISVKNKEDSEVNKELSLSDEIKRISSIKTKDKVKSFDLLLSQTNELRIGVTFSNNLIRLYSIPIDKKHSEFKMVRAISQQGHHSECRSVCFSSDNLAVASGSGESLKLWSRSNMTCLRTIETEYILCTCFVPGDRHVLAGTKSGQLLIVDIVIGEIIEIISAHEKELWSVILTPDSRGCVTGGGDNSVKFWSFELIPDSNNENTKVLSLIHKNTLELEESVLAVKISPNNKYLAVALLDSTVKIFFVDSFKFFLSLYGHKLPVLCLDISYDFSLIATGSADRNVKIWGLDFGDCHRSLFAHDDSVMGLQFIPKTHMFFTCGKDGKIKQWDADTFEKIITLPGHIGEAYALSVSPNGKYLVSCGSDRTLRLFERTEEPLVLQDVQEEEREEIENRTLATGEESTVPGLPGLNLPSRKTVGAEKAAETILECLELGKKFDVENTTEKPALMIALEVENSNDFLLVTLGRIRASDLEEALLLLPFNVVCELLEKLPLLAEKRKDQTELICKVVLFLFRIHHKPIVNHQVLLPSIQKLIKNLEGSVVELRDMIGSNFHAMSLLQRRVEAKDCVELFKDASKIKKVRDKRNKKRQLAKRVHMSI
jgi:U3 small nucleolar RNA-associated protein 12